jgi:hypothetical protein
MAENDVCLMIPLCTTAWHGDSWKNGFGVFL